MATRYSLVRRFAISSDGSPNGPGTRWDMPISTQTLWTSPGDAHLSRKDKKRM